MFNSHRFCKRPLPVGLVFLSQLFISHLAWSETFSLQYNYTGATQQWTVPAGVTSVNFEIAGARGQSSNEAGYDGGYPSAGGKGGSVSGDLQVTPGDTLYINIGGISGWNGGGNGGAFDVYPSLFNAGGKGGGGSDIRIGSNEIAQRVVVGGGGGGGLTTYWCCTTPTRTISGGAGGYPSGSNAPYINNWYASSAGGTQTSGCAKFQGCNGPYSSNVWGGGGGGGYYGGRALSGSSGGGGSSYYDPDLTTNVSYENGVNNGDGYLILVYEASQLGPATVDGSEFEVMEGQSLSATLVFEDPNGLTGFSVASEPGNGSLVVNDSVEAAAFTQLTVPFVYTPGQDYTGADQFSLSVTDGLSTNTEVVISLMVLADADGDGVSDLADPDDDNDGTADVDDVFPFDPAESVDSDGDGVGDNADALPNESSETLDSDGDGIGDNADIDDDNDGVIDPADALPYDSSESLDTDWDGVGNNTDADDDNDGVEDLEDAFPLDANESLDTDGDGIGNNADADDDNDGYLDAGSGSYYVATNVSIFFQSLSGTTEIVAGEELIDSLYNFNLFDFRLSGVDPFEFTDYNSSITYRFTSVIYEQGGISTIATPTNSVVDASPLPIRFTPESAWTHNEFISAVLNGESLGYFTIQAGESDDTDAFPLDPSEWQDSDADGVGDNSDVFPDDATETADSDGDGVGDNADAFPNDPEESTDSDGDGVGDNGDVFPQDPAESADSDGDGVGDNADALPNNPGETTDFDRDGIGDNADNDDDNDGVEDLLDAFPFNSGESLDTDGDGIGNSADLDDDGDGYSENFVNGFAYSNTVNLIVELKSAVTEFASGVEIIEALSQFNMLDMRLLATTDFEFIDDGESGSYRFASVIIKQGIIHAVANPLGGFDPHVIAEPLSMRFQPEIPMDQESLVAAIINGDDLGYFTLWTGTAITIDAFPLDSSEWIDTDFDGYGDNGDAFPNDYTEWLDSDGDGVGNNADVFPEDPSESSDSDADGVGDNSDAFIHDPNESLDTDGDGIGNNADSDDDNDGVDDALDALPLDQYETVDTDGDGIGNNTDPDDDNDGYLDAGLGDYFEASNITINFNPKNTTTDIIPGDELIDDLDDFNLFGLRLSGYQAFEFRDQYTGDDYRFTSVIIEQDGISTSASLIGASEDGSPVPIKFEPETAMTLQALISAILNGDDLGTFSIQRGEQLDIDAFPLDPNEWVDTDGDGVGDNSDAFPNDPSETLDTDGDGVGDNADAFPNDPAESIDSDSDGVGDNADAFPEDASETVDTDGDGIGNNADPDDDNDGYQDYATEAFYEGTTDFVYFYAKDSITSLSPGVQLIWWLSDFNLFDMRYMGYQMFEFNDNDGGPSYRFTSVIVQQGVITARASAINTETGASELVIRLYPELEFTDQELLAAVLDDDELGSFSIEVAEAADLVVDVFPLDPSEWFDTDDDGIGNNADTDDDGDGVADSEDAFPLDVNEIMDTDGDGIGNNADTDDDGDGIPDRVDLTPLGDIFVHNLMDVDGNGHLDPLTDGMLLIRHMFGFTGQALIEDVLGENATRTDPAEIEAHLETIMGSE